MPGGVIGNISHFECDVPGSDPGLATKHVDFSLSGKASACAADEQGSIPGVNQYDLVFGNTTGSFPFWKVNSSAVYSVRF
jgi:hypothetical protein